MTNDFVLIKQLEKEIGEKLVWWKFADIMNYLNSSFSMDAAGNVTGSFPILPVPKNSLLP